MTTNQPENHKKSIPPISKQINYWTSPCIKCGFDNTEHYHYACTTKNDYGDNHEPIKDKVLCPLCGNEMVILPHNRFGCGNNECAFKGGWHINEIKRTETQISTLKEEARKEAKLSLFSNEISSNIINCDDGCGFGDIRLCKAKYKERIQKAKQEVFDDLEKYNRLLAKLPKKCRSKADERDILCLTNIMLRGMEELKQKHFDNGVENHE